MSAGTAALAGLALGLAFLLSLWGFASWCVNLGRRLLEAKLEALEDDLAEQLRIAKQKVRAEDEQGAADVALSGLTADSVSELLNSGEAGQGEAERGPDTPTERPGPGQL